LAPWQRQKVLRVSRPTVSPHPPQEYSISLQATEAGTTKGVKEDLGQYDAKGVLRTSSFETAKKRLRAMMGNTLIV
jgi:hypothetical protein